MDQSQGRDSSRSGQEPVPVVVVDPPTPGELRTDPQRPNIARSTSSAAAPSSTRRLRSQSIRIRRLPSSSAVAQANARNSTESAEASSERLGGGRPRSSSEPQRGVAGLRPPTPRTGPQTANISSIAEEAPHEDSSLPQPVQQPPRPPSGGRLRSSSRAARSALGGLRRLESLSRLEAVPTVEGEYESEIVDVLDLVDPEVSTIQTLTNVQNSLFVPDLGRFLNRTPTYELTRHTTRIGDQLTLEEGKPVAQQRTDPTLGQEPTIKPVTEKQDAETAVEPEIIRGRSGSITSTLSESRYAVLPHGVLLEGWSEEVKEELNDHVRHLLHSRKEKFKRGMRGFGKYIRKPLGFFVTVYAILITLFGLAWVLFLIGWINVGGRQLYIINVIDNVLVALFALVGDVLAPFRAVDTYHMCFIAHYHRLTWRLRREAALQPLHDENDLPSVRRTGTNASTALAQTATINPNDPESGPITTGTTQKEFSMLTPQQQARLQHHQAKFSKSHTFYKPHETATHYAFPLRLLITIVCLLDCHSLFQIALGACTWGISYHHRPGALTAVILSCSISCNVTAGIVISVGDRQTRKKEVRERIFRQALTEQAIRRIEKRHGDLSHKVVGAGREGQHEAERRT